MTEFQTNSDVLVKGFYNSQEVDTISRYLENALKRYPENNQGGGDDERQRDHGLGPKTGSAD